MTYSHTQLQDPASPTIANLINFYNPSIITITIIIIYVIFRKLRFHLTQPASISPASENHELEVLWTIAPGLILITLALPSLQLLYSIEETINPKLIIKITGHQWYWSYDYARVDNLEFDSFIIPTNELNSRNLRLLETDNRIVTPWALERRLLLSSADVLHAWTLPNIGVKADAVPGRINQIIINPIKIGVFYGQCSEICGANHSFIPITIEVIPHTKWAKWISSHTK